MCYNKHLHDMYLDICDLIGSDSWHFHVDSTFVTHILSQSVSRIVRNKSRWIPLLNSAENTITNLTLLFSHCNICHSIEFISWVTCENIYEKLLWCFYSMVYLHIPVILVIPYIYNSVTTVEQLQFDAYWSE